MGLSPRQRFEVLKRDGFTCHYCGRAAPQVELHVDHIHPKSLGGEDSLENYLTACADCNLGKSNRPLTAVTPCYFCDEEPGVYEFDVPGESLIGPAVSIWVCPACLRESVWEMHHLTHPKRLMCAGCGATGENVQSEVWKPWEIVYGVPAWMCDACDQSYSAKPPSS